MAYIYRIEGDKIQERMFVNGLTQLEMVEIIEEIRDKYTKVDILISDNYYDDSTKIKKETDASVPTYDSDKAKFKQTAH